MCLYDAVLFIVTLTIFFVFINETFLFLFPTSVHTEFNYICVRLCVHESEKCFYYVV